MRNTPQAALDRGVITASAGNHAQGVAISAARLGVRATIVVPQTAPQVKVDAVRAHGSGRRWRWCWPAIPTATPTPTRRRWRGGRS